ncbi:mandelate racemase/muconate lactonizing enzyme family protein [Devosia ginsengisoli]|uniref:Mandelate racemase/muconate lactonizing enzyme family protein n=1 Tax=Devosia ginsengisoli TaxID=400770 RepID=A0A5B8LWZ5_9HYPH|nr:mandelate racemase/muconate lactonizing enzyme family protein [Devosia ginsengisoli]QDZ11940.1 mandelate racemase/muconate lactonizing enzyme family protein [Devosia ginsengisoli]
MSRIKSISTRIVRIPFEDGGRGEGITPTRWHILDNVLVRIEDEDGRVGWGEAFGYFCARAVAAAVEDMIAPQVIGRDIDDIAAWNRATQQALHLFGRYGITIFALSGVDIALWDLKAKREGKRLAELIAANPPESVTAYASLVAYRDPDLAARYAGEAVARGYQYIKLHEIAAEPIIAARAAMGQGPGLAVDVNCNWSREQASAMVPVLREADVMWLEEPIFPPEDVATLSAIEAEGIAIGAGENACTAFAFEALISGITFPQPSVTKVGGISVFLDIAERARAAGRVLMPHSPYFGPGYFATLNLFAALPETALFEYLYVTPEAFIGVDTPQPHDGRIALPSGPGLGFAPDEVVVERYLDLSWSR